ncbi:hypothetical protein SALBM311S_10985 [Streptomyces alboniger]
MRSGAGAARGAVMTGRPGGARLERAAWPRCECFDDSEVVERVPAARTRDRPVRAVVTPSGVRRFPSD